jgi:hypothetical protein
MRNSLKEARNSINWVPLLSSAIAAFSAAILLIGSRATPPWLSFAEIVILTALTWLAVRLRFPFLIVVAAIAVGYPSVQQFASLGVIVCSHSLLTRTRFFANCNGEWSEGFAGAASGWLAALSLVLFQGAHVTSRDGLYVWGIPLATLSAAMCFAVLGELKARRTTAKAADRMPTRVLLVASFFVGAAAFLLAIVVLFVLLGGGGGGGSSAPGAWQSKPQLQPQPSAEPRQ